MASLRYEYLDTQDTDSSSNYHQAPMYLLEADDLELEGLETHTRDKTSSAKSSLYSKGSSAPEPTRLQAQPHGLVAPRASARSSSDGSKTPLAVTLQ